MFDFESDRDDPRFARPNGNANTAPTQPEAPASPITQQRQPAVIINDSSRSAVGAEAQAKPTAIPLPPPVQPPRSIVGAPAQVRAPRQRTAPARKRNDWIWLVLAAALILVFIVMGITLAALVNANRDSSLATEPTVPDIAALPTPVDARLRYEPSSVHDGQTVMLDDGEEITLKAWDGSTRLNLLLLGIDRRPGETGLAYRTDTIIIASLDPKTHSVGLLSIPRDLYVQLPGYSAKQRINTALPLGEQQRAGYGPTLAMQTVQMNIGMPINDYVIADFNALIKLVDTIGGIDIDVPAPIADYNFPDMGYGYDPLILSAGLQHLDGYTAQKYARTRHGDSDFDRARRQQQVLFAIRDRVLSLDALPQLILQAPSLYASVSQNVNTGLTLDQMISLALWLKDLPVENISSGVIDQHYVSDYTTADGAEVLVPYANALPNLLAQVFGSDYAVQ